MPGSVPVAFPSSYQSLSSLQVPFLSVGGDIGVRTVRHRDTSPLSGEYVVEDVKGDGTCYFRRLIFLCNRNVVQSEVRLLPPTPLPGMWGIWEGTGAKGDFLRCQRVRLIQEEDRKKSRWDMPALSWSSSGSVFTLRCLPCGWDRG